MRISRFSIQSSLFLALALLAALPFLAAASHPTRRSPPDVCSLLTPTQLERVLGQPFQLSGRSLAPASSPGEPAGQECDYTTQRGVTRKVVFIAFIHPSSAQARETYDELSRWLTPKVKIAGLGDGAYVDDNHAIHVVKGKVRYYISIVPLDVITSENGKQLRDLAALIAAQV